MENRKLSEILSQISNLNVQVKNIEATSTKANPAAEMLISFVPVLALVLGSVLFFFFLFWQYKLGKMLVQNQQYRPNWLKNIKIFSLLFGINGTLLGLPLCLILLIIEKRVSYSLLGGLVPFCLGMGMLVFYSFIRNKIETK